MKIRDKLISTYLLIILIGLSILMVFTFLMGRSIMVKQSFEHLTSVRENKSYQIEKYFENIHRQVEMYAKDPTIKQACEAFVGTFAMISEEMDGNGASNMDGQLLFNYYDSLFIPKLNQRSQEAYKVEDLIPQDSKARFLQDCFIASNPYDLGQKDELISCDKSGVDYARVHTAYHPYFRDIIKNFGFYDLFIIDTLGNVVYTVSKETDFATNLKTGPYKNTGLASTFLTSLDEDRIVMVDFQGYQPSYNAAASFIGIPIKKEDSTIGVLAIQVPIDQIESVMTGGYQWEKEGLGKSGETYIVGADYLMRNNSRFFIQDEDAYFDAIAPFVEPELIEKISKFETTILLSSVNSKAVNSALEGQSGEAIVKDYRNIDVFSSFKPLRINDVNWVILSEIDRSEALKGLYTFTKVGLLFFVLLILATVLTTVIIAGRIARPISRLSTYTKALSKDFYSFDPKADTLEHISKRPDEVGELGQAFHNLSVELRSTLEARDKANLELKNFNENLEKLVAERTSELKKTTKRFSLIIENSTDAIITIDDEQKIRLFNPSAEKIFGYKSEEIIGEDLVTIIPEKFRHKHPSLVDSFGRTNQTSKVMGERLEIYGKRKNGEIFTGEAGISKLEYNGQIFFTAFFRDITERKKMEALVLKAKERMENELNIARDIQMGMLPLIFPAFPEHEEFSIYGTLKPAREVGGDFYDFFFIDESHFCFVIGDVSGKGVPSALFMAVTKTLIKSRASNDLSPSSILTHVNDEMSKDNQSSMFVTIFLGILDIQTGEVTFTNAGHNPPYIRKKDGTLIRLSDRHGPVIGAVEGMTYSEGKDHLEKDDMLWMYTDGVTEALDLNDQLFTEKRLMDILVTKDSGQLQKGVEEVLQAVHEFEKGREQADDITLLAFTFWGIQDEGLIHRFSMKVKNEFREIERVYTEFNTFADKNSIPAKISRKINLAFDELINNIISYAYQDEEEHEIKVLSILANDILTIVIEDDGMPFNPFQQEQPDTQLPAEERDIGGLGIHLVRNLMDSFTYHRQIKKNVVTLKKKITD